MCLPFQGLVDAGEKGGACSCREVVRGALRRRDHLWFFWESRFDLRLLQEKFFILELGP